MKYIFGIDKEGPITDRVITTENVAQLRRVLPKGKHYRKAVFIPCPRKGYHHGVERL